MNKILFVAWVLLWPVMSALAFLMEEYVREHLIKREVFPNIVYAAREIAWFVIYGAVAIFIWLTP